MHDPITKDFFGPPPARVVTLCCAMESLGHEWSHPGQVPSLRSRPPSLPHLQQRRRPTWGCPSSDCGFESLLRALDTTGSRHLGSSAIRHNARARTLQSLHPRPTYTLNLSQDRDSPPRLFLHPFTQGPLPPRCQRAAPKRNDPNHQTKLDRSLVQQPPKSDHQAQETRLRGGKLE